MYSPSACSHHLQPFAAFFSLEKKRQRKKMGYTFFQFITANLQFNMLSRSNMLLKLKS